MTTPLAVLDRNVCAYWRCKIALLTGVGWTHDGGLLKMVCDEPRPGYLRCVSCRELQLGFEDKVFNHFGERRRLCAGSSEPGIGPVDESVAFARLT